MLGKRCRFVGVRCGGFHRDRGGASRQSGGCDDGERRTTARLQRNGAQFRMRWPLASSSYILQSTTNLLAPVWRDETNALSLNGDTLETDVAPGALKFYRLRKP